MKTQFHKKNFGKKKKLEKKNTRNWKKKVPLNDQVLKKLPAFFMQEWFFEKKCGKNKMFGQKIKAKNKSSPPPMAKVPPFFGFFVSKRFFQVWGAETKILEKLGPPRLNFPKGHRFKKHFF